MLAKVFESLASAFSVVFIDQFGVLHNGSRPYSGAIDALKTLKARGTRVVILSNSGKSGQANAKRMEGLGFAPGLYDHFRLCSDR
jgi:ribonucleotide monophosphatase NagD (HAD superfamily)